jgi:aminoglycoside 6'-N-acetyltransferase I
MVVRRVVPADREAWIRMRMQLWPMHSAAEASAGVDEYYSCHDRMGVFVADDDGHLVGFAEVSLRDQAERCTTSPVGYLEAWYVEDEARKSGVGRELVRAAESWAEAQGCSEMASDCVIGSSASFEAHTALGYEETLRLIHFRKTLGGGA